jgi:hypothetical protein
MKQNKGTYVVDNFIDIKGTQKLYQANSALCAAGILFIVEPWSAVEWRIYVRKDVAHVLEKIEEALNK